MTEQQADLFDTSIKARHDDGTYPVGFWEWIEANWPMYEAFVALARRAKRNGISHWSADAVCHVLRWETAVRGSGQPDFKINNNAVAGLSRLAMARCPDLAGYFSKRAPPGRAEARRLDGSLYTEPRA